MGKMSVIPENPVFPNSVLPKSSVFEKDMHVHCLQYLNVVNYMSGTYGSAKVCPYENQACDLDGPDAMSLEPDIEAILADTPNRQWDELEYYWTAWRDVTGKVYRNEYYEYIDWINKGALANGLADGSEMWLIPYTQDLDPGDNFNDDLELVWAQVRPLYEKVHAYVRWKYIQHWGPLGNFIGTRDPIPAHITGTIGSLPEYRDVG